jgi:hypothetical protein
LRNEDVASIIVHLDIQGGKGTVNGEFTSDGFIRKKYVFRRNIYTHALIYNLAMVWYLYNPPYTGSIKKESKVTIM